MQYRITEIEFDFDDSFEVENYDQDVIDEVLDPQLGVLMMLMIL